MYPQEPLACPDCHQPLEKNTKALACQTCRHKFDLQVGGYYDLRLNKTEYLDIMANNAENMAQYLELYAPTEREGARHMMQNYLGPLLETLAVPKGGKILSAGCGGGWDVETLHQMGYLAWGVDNGSRRILWEKQGSKEFLSFADALQLPYQDNYFDFVFTEGTIEHIGCPGDTYTVSKHCQQDRQSFVNSMVRVLKPGGSLLIGCPNRLFPIDFFHGGRPIAGINMRFHAPREPFLLSYKDIRAYLPTEMAEISALSLKNFFNLRNNLNKGFVRKAVFGFMDVMFGILPPVFWKSPFSPYVVVLAKKGNKELTKIKPMQSEKSLLTDFFRRTHNSLSHCNERTTINIFYHFRSHLKINYIVPNRVSISTRRS